MKKDSPALYPQEWTYQVSNRLEYIRNALKYDPVRVTETKIRMIPPTILFGIMCVILAWQGTWLAAFAVLILWLALGLAIHTAGYFYTEEGVELHRQHAIDGLVRREVRHMALAGRTLNKTQLEKEARANVTADMKRIMNDLDRIGGGADNVMNNDKL